MRKGGLSMATQRTHTIDILRLAAAFCIICLHNFSGSGVWLAEEIVALCRFAVPFFFVLSGYFSANFTFRRKLRQFIRILAWAVAANLAYLAVDLHRQGPRYLATARLVEIFSADGVWTRFLLWNHSPISEHLWFLGALAYILLLDLLFAGLFARLRHGRALQWGIALALLLGGLGLYTFIPGFQLCWYRNFLFMGLPFFLMGKLLRNSGFAKKSLPAPLYPALILALCGLTVLEYHLRRGQENISWELYLSTLPMPFLLLHLGLCHPLANARGPAALLAWLGKNATLAVYIVHIYVLDQLRGLYWANLPWQYEFGVFHLIPLGVFLISLLAGALAALCKEGVLALAVKWRAGKAGGHKT